MNHDSRSIYMTLRELSYESSLVWNESSLKYSSGDVWLMLLPWVSCWCGFLYQLPSHFFPWNIFTWLSDSGRTSDTTICGVFRQSKHEQVSFLCIFLQTSTNHNVKCQVFPWFLLLLFLLFLCQTRYLLDCNVWEFLLILWDIKCQREPSGEQHESENLTTCLNAW